MRSRRGLASLVPLIGVAFAGGPLDGVEATLCADMIAVLPGEARPDIAALEDANGELRGVYRLDVSALRAAARRCSGGFIDGIRFVWEEFSGRGL